MTHEQKLQILKEYFENIGFKITDGLKYGVDLLLYADEIYKVHSRYAVLLIEKHNFLDLIAVQRVCGAVNKELIIADFVNDDLVFYSVERVLRNNSETKEEL